MPPGASDTHFHIYDATVPTVKSNFPDEANLLDALRSWVADAAAWWRLLVDNPAARYRF